MRSTLTRITFGLAALGLLVFVAGCSDDSTPTNKDTGPDQKVGDMAVGDTATGDTATGDTATGDTAPSNPYTSVSAITTYLEGKTLTMSGSNIPSHPLGYDQNTNFGQATQCYSKVTIKSTSGPKFSTTSDLGTLTGAPNTGDTGTCDNGTVSTTLTFDSTVVAIENVKSDGSCFDVTVTYTGFKQEGRAMLSADGKTLRMELYFEGQATGHRCADGAVGASGVTLNGNAFSGNSVQVYDVTVTP